MKAIVLLSISFIMFASSNVLYIGKTLSDRKHIFIHGTSNYRPSIRIKNKRKIHTLHKVNEEEARIIAIEKTKEKVTSLKLTHVNKYLFYKINTEHYHLKINALDGTIMQKQNSK